MKVSVTVTPLKSSGDVEDKHMYYVKIKTYNGKLEGKFEKSELRLLIQKIDNAII